LARLGEQYRDYKKRERPERGMEVSCSCPGGVCLEKINEEEEHEILLKFNRLPSHETQNAYLRGLRPISKICDSGYKKFD